MSDYRNWGDSDLQSYHTALRQVETLWNALKARFPDEIPAELRSDIIRLDEIPLVETALHQRNIIKPQNKLPDKQQRILNYIQEYIPANDGISPTVKEITLALDISSTSVCKWNLDKLIKAGWITQKPNKARSIRLVAMGQTT